MPCNESRIENIGTIFPAQKPSWNCESRARILFRTMLRNAFFLVVMVFFFACSQSEGSTDYRLPEEDTSSSSGATGSSGSSGSSSGTSGVGGGGGATLGPCDDAGVCGDYVSGCTGCAVSGACAEVYDGCFGDDSCLDFNKCLANCKADETCRQGCVDANPVGAERYNALVTCIVCQVCPTSCVEFANFCL